MANLTFVPDSGKTGTTRLTLDQISDEVKTDVEEVYKALKANPGRMRVSFPSVGELNAYEAQMKAYCELRPSGPLAYRKSPSRKLSPTNPNGLKDTEMEFRISDVPAANADTVAINGAVADVKAAAKK